jgi:hypothetical protein
MLSITRCPPNARDMLPNDVRGCGKAVVWLVSVNCRAVRRVLASPRVRSEVNGEKGLVFYEVTISSSLSSCSLRSE